MRTIVSKVILIIIMVPVPLIKAAAQTKQPCIVEQYNEEKPKTPLSGVEVMASNAGSTVSANDGTFTLTFRTLKPGDKVNLISAKKAGYEVMNTPAVKQWFISRNNTPFSLLMVKSDHFAQRKERLTQTCTQYYKTKYEKAVRELEHLRKENKIREEEFNKQYDEQEAIYHKKLSSLDNYIEQFARVDLSEVSELEQRILNMVEEGKVDEALQLYDEANLLGKIQDETSRYSNLTEMVSKIDNERSQAISNFSNLFDSFQRHISILQLSGRDMEVKERLSVMIEEIDKQNKLFPLIYRAYLAELNLQMGDFLLENRWLCEDDEEAKIYLQAAEKQYKKIVKKSDGAFYYALAKSQISLGKVYANADDDKKAELKYQNGLTILNQLLGQDSLSNEIRGYIAYTQHQLGSLYLDMYTDEVWDLITETRDTSSNNARRILDIKKKAETAFMGSFENYRKVLPSNPKKFSVELADAQNDLGFFYLLYNECPKAEKLFLDIRQNMENMSVDKDSIAYDKIFISASNKLVEVYGCEGTDKDKIEECRITAFELCKKRLGVSTEYAHLYQTTLEELASFYYGLDNEKLRRLLEDAVAQCKLVFQEQPSYRYRNLYHFVYDKLARYYSDKKLYEDFLLLYKHALEEYVPLAINDPEKYSSLIYHLYYELEEMYKKNKVKEEFEKVCLESLSTWKSICERSPKELDHLVLSYISLGDFYWKEKAYEKASIHYHNALESVANPNVSKWLRNDVNYIRNRLLFLENNIKK